jgi:hypothetical protein
VDGNGCIPNPYVESFNGKFRDECLNVAQGLGILLYAFYFVDNSHPGVDMHSVAALLHIYKSDTLVSVYIIPTANFIVALIYFIWEFRRKMGYLTHHIKSDIRS